jgi:hypothetical protein
MVSAPVEYIPRDFVLHLFGELCRTILKKVDYDPDDALDPNITAGRWWALATRIAVVANVLLGASGIALLVLYLATDGLATEQRRVTLGAALALAGVLLVSTLVAPMRPPVSEGPRAGRRYPPWERLFLWRPSVTGCVLLVGAGATLILWPLAGLALPAKLVQGLGLIVGGLLLAMIAGLARWTAADRFVTGARVRPTHDQLQMAAWDFAVGALHRLSWLLVGTGMGWLALWWLNIQPGSTVASGLGLLVTGGVLAQPVRSWARQVSRYLRGPLIIPVSPGDSDVANLAPRAVDLLRQIKFQQTWTSGWSGTLKVPGGAKLPLGLEEQRSGGSSMARLPMTYPELVGTFRAFVEERAAPYGPVVIGIDELDKMESDQTARKFLNDIKAIFGLHNCFYLVSVSEDALASFERRGIPFRDVFDSSFDEVVDADYFDLDASKELLSSQAYLDEPFDDLCYCLSGGLARDLIRTARDMFDARGQEDVGLAELCRRVVLTEQEARSTAVIMAIKSIELEPAVSDLLCWIQGITVSKPDPSSATPNGHANSRRLWERAGKDLINHIDVEEEARQPIGLDHDENAAPARQTLQRLGGEFLGFHYYCATVLQFFEEHADTRSLKRARSKESGPASLDHLAHSRQAFALNAPLAWHHVTQFREAWGLKHLQFPEALLDRPILRKRL